MKAISFPEVNKTYQAEGCFDLPVFHYEHFTEDGKKQIFCITSWMPSEEDKAAILAGRPIILQIFGGQPPVSVLYLR